MSVLFMLKPIHGLDYFVRYYRLIEQVWLYHSSKIVTRVNVFNLLMVLASVRFFYLTFWRQDNALERAIRFDAFTLMIGKQQMNLIAFMCFPMILYFTHKLYVTTNYPLVRMLYPVIVHRDWGSFFIRSKLNNRDVCNRTRRCYLLVFNLFNCLIGTFELIWIISYLHFNWTIVCVWMQSETNYLRVLLWITVGNLNGMLLGILFDLAFV